MNKKLKEIANLILGFTFRGAIMPDPKGNSLVFQAKNIIFDKDKANLQSLTKISFEGFRGAYFLQANDIVLTLRGTGIGSFRAAVVRGGESAIASSSILITRLIDKKLLPEYLSIYFNSNEGQKKILKSVTGSYIQTISRSKLAEIDIPIPPISSQGIIIKLADNLKRQREICERKIQINKNIANGIFEKLT